MAEIGVVIRRRVLWAAMVAAAAVVAALVTSALVTASSLRSPEQAAAEAAPPSASSITVAAEHRVLTEPVVLRGRVLPGESEKVHPPTAVVGADSVVTGVLVQTGQSLEHGQPLLVIAGEAMFVLELPFPLYRDLAGGMAGPDVAEVQEALTRLGYWVGATGTFDGRTQRAVGRFYADRGFIAPPGNPEAVTGLPAAQDAVDVARAVYDEAVQTDNGVTEAEAALSRAEQDLASMELAAGPGLPRGAVLQRPSVSGDVTAVRIRVGDTLDTREAVLLELNGGDPYVTATAALDQVNLIATGRAATVVDEATGREADAVIDSVGDELVTDELTGRSGFQVRVTFTGEAMEPTEDRTVRVDLSETASDSEVLAVPLTAVYSRPDGSTFVTVQRLDGATADVTVTTGQIAGGWVEVALAEDPGLVPGDQVVVGTGGG